MEAKIHSSLCDFRHFSSNSATIPNSSLKPFHSPIQTSFNTLSRSLNLGFRSSYPPPILASNSATQPETDSLSSVSPVYVPTPPNRELRTPHSGYHFDGTTRQFFEGWYFKVAIPERRQSFCFMYVVENPAFRGKLTPLEVAQYGPRFTGVAAQILGPDDQYLCKSVDESPNFWGSRHELALGNTFVAEKGMQPPTKEVPPQEFNRRVSEGFQVTPLWHQGFICDDGRIDFAQAVKTARWEYSTRPVYGWGDVSSKQKFTAGWLAVLPVFEPHWQICMAGGLSTGITLSPYLSSAIREIRKPFGCPVQYKIGKQNSRNRIPATTTASTLTDLANDMAKMVYLTCLEDVITYKRTWLGYSKS